MGDRGSTSGAPDRDNPRREERRPDAPRWRYRLNNLKRANARLQEAAGANLEGLSLLEREGMIQRFEYTFELAWKTLKDVLEHDGVVFDVVTPRDVIRRSVAAGQLTHEDIWMAMLADRRRTSHEYDEEHLMQVTGSIREQYAGALDGLVESLMCRESREA